MRGYVSPLLGIRFEPGKGPDNLTIIGRDGQPFITPLEMSRRRAEAERRAQAERHRAEAAEERAETERQRAESAQERAESAQERAQRYAAKLRALGMEPD
jgi:hypothetical protein